jgi:hypothetical protein
MPRPLLRQEEEGQLSPLWQDILPGLSFQTGACRPENKTRSVPDPLDP